MILHYRFTELEKVFMNKHGFSFSESMEAEEANALVENIADLLQSMSDTDLNIGEDIITKITTHVDW